jgi:hypothetical protein
MRYAYTQCVCHELRLKVDLQLLSIEESLYFINTVLDPLRPFVLSIVYHSLLPLAVIFSLKHHGSRRC